MFIYRPSVPKRITGTNLATKCSEHAQSCNEAICEATPHSRPSTMEVMVEKLGGKSTWRIPVYTVKKISGKLYSWHLAKLGNII